MRTPQKFYYKKLRDTIYRKMKKKIIKRFSTVKKSIRMIL